MYYVCNLLNGKGYVGKHHTLNVEVRWKKHWQDARRGSATPIHRALRKYGERNFSWEVVWRGSVHKLDEKEKFYIEKFSTCIDDGAGYNLTLGGDGGTPSRYMARRRAKAIKLAWIDKHLRARHSEILKSAFSDPQCRVERSAQRRSEWKRPGYREQQERSRAGKYHRPTYAVEDRAKLADSTRAWWRSKFGAELKAAKAVRTASLTNWWANITTEQRKAFSDSVKAGWVKRKAAKGGIECRA